MTMPALSPTMTEGTISTFHVSPGDEVSAGDSIALVETDKAIMEFEVQEDAFVAWVNSAAIGNKVKLGTACAVLVDSKDQVPLFKDYSPETAPKASAPQPSAPQVQSQAEPSPQVTEPAQAEEVQLASKVFISPRAFMQFQSQGFEKEGLATRLAQLAKSQGSLGSGPHGRVIEQDVDALVQKLSEPAELQPKPAQPRTAQAEMPGVFREVELSTMRRVIAERLSQSKREIPHYYLDAELRMDALLEMKRELQEKAGVKLSVNDFIVKAVAKAGKEVPECNTNFVDGKVRYFEQVDVR